MGKSKITGWKNVFSFTFIQTVKGKAIRITALVLCVVALLSTTVVNLIGGTDKEKTETTIKEVYVIDETGMNIISGLEKFVDISNVDTSKDDTSNVDTSKDDASNVDTSKDDVSTSDTATDDTTVEESIYSKIKFRQEDRNLEEMTEFLKHANKDSEEGNAAVLLDITYQENMFHIQMIYGSDSKVTESDAEDFCAYISDNFTHVLSAALQIEESKIEFMNMPVHIAVESYMKADGEEPAEAEGEETVEADNSELLYSVMMTFIVVIVMLLAFAGEGIASSILTEKSTRVIEYIMITVKPMAIVVGKVFSMLSIILIEAALIIACLFASGFVSDAILGSEGGYRGIQGLFDSILQIEMSTGRMLLNIIIILPVLIMAFIFYGMIASVVGASVSKIEELSEGVKTYSFILVISAYISLGIPLLAISGVNISQIVTNFFLIFPLTSPFMLPVYLITGKVSVLIGVISLVVLGISLYLLTLFVSSVYGYLIYYNGNPLKIKDIIKLAISNKKGGVLD